VKFSGLQALERHLEALPLPLVYLIACPYETDRREIAAKIASVIRRLDPQSSWLRFAGSTDFAGALEELQTENLFASSRVIFLDEADQLKEEESSYLRSWIQKPSGKLFLIMGIENTRGLAPFLPLVQKEGVVLFDLLQEKPWDRQRRIIEDLHAIASRAKIALDQEVFDFLLQQVGMDWTLLKSEMEKLLCYAEGKKQLLLQDARLIVAAGVFPEGWALAEQLIFNPYSLASSPALDATALLSLLGQMRYYLRMGRQIALGEEKGYLPLKPYQVQKFGDKARERGPQFFEKGLIALNDVEALAKSSSISSELLLSRFVVNLHIAI
jgi:DNA polymerase III delta subunit